MKPCSRCHVAKPLDQFGVRTRGRKGTPTSRCLACLEYHRRYDATRREAIANTRRALRVRHPLYETWTSLLNRCLAPNAPNYHHYGGRGITVLTEWRDSFTAFEQWVNENLGSRPEGHTLDRIDNDGNYEPGNLRWATQSEQNANQRRWRKAA